MSDHYNHMFVADPMRFINQYSVDIKTWFENLVRRRDQHSKFYGALVGAASAAGVCRIDLAPVGGFLGAFVDTVEVRLVRHGGINVYWAPYNTGPGLPGFTDVLRVNPPCKFVFTPGMNGCAFVVTDSPRRPLYMRVYHHQHPNNPGIWGQINVLGQPVISYADFTDYDGGPLPNNIAPVAFNFLYYRNGVWHYVFSHRLFRQDLLNTPDDSQASMRSVF